MSSPLSWPAGRPVISGRAAWIVLIGNAALSLAVMYVAWNNIRLVKAWEGARKAPIRRGCVGLEFSDDQQKWETSEAPGHLHRYLRLHNYCSSITVSIDSKDGRAFLTPEYPALDVQETPEVEQH